MQEVPQQNTPEAYKSGFNTTATSKKIDIREYIDHVEANTLTMLKMVSHYASLQKEMGCIHLQFYDVFAK